MWIWVILIKRHCLLWNGRADYVFWATDNIVTSIYLWFYSPLLDLGRFFSFSFLSTVDRTHWTSDEHVARPLPIHRTTQTQNKRKHPCLEWDSKPRSQC
jgi:hypothetical protein